MNIRHTIIGALSVLLFTFAVAGAARGENGPYKGYNFVLTIRGNHDSIMYLGNYYAGKPYAFDTARIDKRGRFVFKRSDRVLNPGVYFFTNPSGNYVEFMLYHEKPDFTFNTEERGWASSMEVKGSKQNIVFFDFHRINSAMYARADSLRLVFKDDSLYAVARQRVVHEMDSIKERLIADNPQSLLAIIMNATREVPVPRVDSTGRKLTDIERWEYYMEHFFDNTKLDDDAIIRTPDAIFHQRLTRYLDVHLKNATPEIIIKYVDNLIDKAKPSKENFRYLVHTIGDKYLQSNIMSYDAVYVNIVQRYIATGDAWWMSPSAVDENVKRATTWERILIGKPAPPLIMKDINGTLHSLYGIDHKYTLLVFWSPSCGHCKTMIPDLYKSYVSLKDRYDVEAFAVLSEPDESNRAKWKDFIEKHNLDWLNIDGGEANLDWHEVYDVVTTPQIFLLDKDKKIVAKKLNARLFEYVLKAMEGEEVEPID